jgi:hypothetical protein
MRRSRTFRSEQPRSPFSLACRIKSFPLHYYALIGLLAVAVAVGAQSPANAPYQTVPQSPQSTAPATPSETRSAATMAQAVQLAAAARQTFQTVRDYTCLMIKRERIQRQLEPENIMEVKIRNQPFSVYLHWLGPGGLAGQEACFVAGRNNNMMRVHPTGFKGAFGFLSIAPDDPRVMEHSRHKITEAGLGNLIQRLNTCWEIDRQQNTATVRIAEYEYDKRRCTRVEIIRPGKSTGPCAFYRTVAYFDKETHLPVRVELYDWPCSGGNAGGDIVESYSYVNLRFNVGLTDKVFEH